MKNYLPEILHQPASIDQVAGVFFWGRSGSYLLYSFLDNHPHILQLPLSSWGYNYLQLDNLLQQIGNLAQQEAAELVLNTFQFLSRSYQKECKTSVSNDALITRLGDGESGAVMGVDPERFVKAFRIGFEALRNQKQLSRANLFKAICVAYGIAKDRVITTDKPLIVVDVHATVPKTMELLNSDFPAMKYLYSVRVPHKTLDSHIYHHTYEKPFHRQVYSLTRLLADTDHVPTNLRSDQMRAVRFEDIHLYPKKTMEAVTNFLGIPWDNTLLDSTLDGYRWWFKKNNKLITGSNPHFVSDNNLKMFSKLDVVRIKFLFKKVYDTWGYECKKNRTLSIVSILVPTKVQLLAFTNQMGLLYKSISSLNKPYFSKVLRGIKGLAAISLHFFRDHLYLILLAFNIRKEKNELLPLLHVEKEI